jgi:SAM-dependent methyltransferase
VKYPSLRRTISALRRTPLHPQWLLATRASSIPEISIASITGGSVLDIGCADRWPEPRLAPACHYIALDYPATGRDLYGARPDIFATASQLPLQDGSVGTVLLFEVVEHLSHPRLAFEEIARVLQPGGRLLLTMPFLYPIHDAPHDYQRLTVHGLARDITAAGLILDRVKPSLGSAETAGLIACLALGGMAMQAIERRRATTVLIPLIAVAIPVINLLAWVAGRVMPSWDAVSAGYELVAHKP